MGTTSLHTCENASKALLCARSDIRRNSGEFDKNLTMVDDCTCKTRLHTLQGAAAWANQGVVVRVCETLVDGDLDK